MPCGPEFARKALAERAEPGLGGGEGGEVGLAAHRGARAGQQQRPCAPRHHAAQRLAAEQEAAEAADPPAGLEILRLHFERAARHVVAGVEDGEVDRPLALRRFDEGGDRGFVGGVGDDGRGVSSCRADRIGNRLDLGFGAAADEDVEAFARRHAAHRRPKPFACAHADYDRRLAHFVPRVVSNPAPRRAAGEYSFLPAGRNRIRRCVERHPALSRSPGVAMMRAHRARRPAGEPPSLLS